MKNREYWQQRFTLLEESQNKKANEYLNILKEEYEKSLSKIEKDITSWYARLADNNEISLADAKKLLDKKELQEFKWTVEEYIQKGKENAVNQKWITELENASVRVHINKLEAIKIQVQNELEQLAAKQDKDITDLLKNQYENAYYKSAFEIQKGLERYWNIQPLDADKIKKIISKPWTTDDKTFSNRIWNNKEELLNTLQKDLTQAIARGDDIQNVINKIEKDFKVSKNRAGTLVMTESAFFSSTGQKECFNNLGVKKYEIVATLDNRTSEICQKMDGTIFDMKDYQVGITAPPFHCNCRTIIVPYFNDEFAEGEKRVARDENGKTIYVDSKMKYKEWKEKYINNETNTSTNDNKNDKIISKLGNSNKNSIGGTGKGVFIQKINIKDIDIKLKEYEEEIRNKSKEYGVLIDEKGNIYAYTGDKTNLAITDRSLDDVTLTHNHPEVGSFGKDDYILLYDNPNIKELRAVDNKYNYKLKLLKPLDKHYNEIYRKSGDIMRELLDEEQHCVMLKLKELGYIEYDRTRKK